MGQSDSATLERALDFSDEDLQANRSGSITERQREKLSSYRRVRGCGSVGAGIAVIGAVLLIFALPLLAPGMLGEGGLGSYMNALPYIGLAALVVIGLFMAFLTLGYLRGLDLDRGQVSTVTGAINLKARPIRGQYVNATRYELTIKEQRFFSPTKAAFEAFREGQVYRVYYIKYPPGHILLSAELV